MVRLLVGALAGIVMAGIVITVFETGAHALWPPPPGLDLTTSQGTAAMAAAMPPAALMAVLAGWFSGALVGGVLANIVSRQKLSGWIVAGLILAATLYMLYLIPHPFWMLAGGISGPFIAAWLAGRIVRSA